MRNYIGITIGPIFETISEATSPAALWFASTMFSDVTRRLCKEIKLGFSDAEILSPAFDEDDSDGLKDGVGKYHDRIFFTSEEASQQDCVQKLNAIIAKVKEETADVLCDKACSDKEAVKAFFTNYIYVEYVLMNEAQLNEKNCILAMSCYLDELELMQVSGVTGIFNPIEAMFKGPSEDNRNGYIKESGLLKTVSVEQNHLQNSKNQILSIEDIAGVTAGKAPKYAKYYAVVNADGDRMGAFLKEIRNDSGLITAFSASCLNYNKEVAGIISAFGGMPIYAGGDDLLFLAPVVGTDDKTVFALCEEIGELFVRHIKDTVVDGKKVFEGYDTPTLSFAVSVQYYKYPLYEALAKGRELLAVAKNDSSEEKKKNRMAIRLEKHSGQTIEIIIGNEFEKSFDEFIKRLFDKDSLQGGDAIRAISYKMQEFATMLEIIDERVASGELTRTAEHYPWDNLFDNDSQKGFQNYLRFVQDWYYDELVPQATRVIATDGEGNNNNIHKLEVVLRFAKFLTEGGAENE